MIEQSVSSGASGEELTATNAAFANNTMFGFRVSSSVSRLNLMTEESPQFIDSLKCSHEECQETFVRLVDLHNHMFFVHNKVKQECPICQQQFATPKLLRLHEKTHGDYACGICGQRFNEKAYLKLHLKNHDADREIFACHLCRKTFKHKGNLQVHIKSIHEKKKFRCMLCDRELSTKQKLDQHMAKRHEALEENLEIDLIELEKFEKEWAAKNEPVVKHDREEDEENDNENEEENNDRPQELDDVMNLSKRIKLEPTVLKSQESPEIQQQQEQQLVNNFNLADSDFEFLYND